jgi:hypothetical protein
MADWTDIDVNDLLPGEPWTSGLALAAFENPEAIAEGATGAPRIADAAMGGTATSAGRDWVLARTALAEFGAVGTYAFLGMNSTTLVTQGSTRAGSDLRPAGIVSSQTFNNATLAATLFGGSTSAQAGTWRCMGVARNGAADSYGASLWLRIA